jgi:hypothetical protein
MLEKQLSKFLNVIVKDKYPMVEKISVEPYGDNNNFKVVIGVSRKELDKHWPEVTREKIMTFVKQSSLYIIGSDPTKEKITWVRIYDPSDED